MVDRPFDDVLEQMYDWAAAHPEIMGSWIWCDLTP